MVVEDMEDLQRKFLDTLEKMEVVEKELQKVKGELVEKTINLLLAGKKEEYETVNNLLNNILNKINHKVFDYMFLVIRLLQLNKMVGACGECKLITPTLNGNKFTPKSFNALTICSYSYAVEEYISTLLQDIAKITANPKNHLQITKHLRDWIENKIRELETLHSDASLLRYT